MQPEAACTMDLPFPAAGRRKPIPCCCMHLLQGCDRPQGQARGTARTCRASMANSEGRFTAPCAPYVSSSHAAYATMPDVALEANCSQMAGVAGETAGKERQGDTRRVYVLAFDALA